jgi:hypothetical protein
MKGEIKMKERPIIMGADSVRAILDGRKTQTRRVIKPQPKFIGAPNVPFKTDDANPKGIINCPYCKVGDRLWVREIFNCNEEGIAYKATQPDMDGLPWKSPIYMPRTYSRITLEITDIRVERLQDITAQEAIAEGMPIPYVARDEYEPISMYRELWEKLNSKRGYPWESNPWVWVIEFKVV